MSLSKSFFTFLSLALGGSALAANEASKAESYKQFMDSNKTELQWFENVPVGHSGLPLIIFKLLPDIFPDLWSAKDLQDTGFLPKLNSQDQFLPQGLGYGIGSTQIIPLPGFEKVRMQIVNFSCAGCHTGYVRLEQGELQKIVGAPNTRSDGARWRRKIYLTSIDPRFTAENFLAAAKKYKTGSIYGLKNVALETFDRTIMKVKGKDIVQGIVDKLKVKEYQVQNYLGAQAYGNDMDLLNGITPGQVEAFGVAVAKFLPINADDTEIRSKYNLSFDEFLNSALQNAPAVVDIPSVWNQKDRLFVQWDGNVSEPTLRNLAAAVGVIGDPELVDFDNAYRVGKLLRNLPAPAYPFAINTAKAARGKAVYDQACASCHTASEQVFMPLAQIGTDGARANAMSPLGSTLLAGEMMKACADKKVLACQETDLEKVILPRYKNPGYVSGPLDGLWARAPYLHNGSVPTLEHLLVPASRPSVFYRGNFDYDQSRLGFVWDRPDADFSSTFETSRNGNSNSGHADKTVFFGGIDFEKDVDSREALIEFLKTL